ncbi:MAG: 4'-phosphopantetheinyl transferase superfamily protein [Anaerolineaceae bacterium]|nr:4'-phosphopantetheinyl transferase superfamily protein [Anaerolineaceae bacterium]
MNKRVYWSIADVTDIERSTSFLSEAEQSIYDKFRFDLRRDSFLAGRWVAKGLIRKALSLSCSYCDISILNETSGKPYAVVEGERLDSELSISHSGDWAAAALSVDGLQIGVDVEVVSPRPNSFAADYFTSAECALLNDQSENYDRNVTVIWSAKEAMLKALGLGLRLDTRRVQVTAIGSGHENNPDGWLPLEIESENNAWVAYWQQLNEAVLVCAIKLTDTCEIELIKL